MRSSVCPSFVCIPESALSLFFMTFQNSQTLGVSVPKSTTTLFKNPLQSNVYVMSNGMQWVWDWVCNGCVLSHSISSYKRRLSTSCILCQCTFLHVRKKT